MVLLIEKLQLLTKSSTSSIWIGIVLVVQLVQSDSNWTICGHQNPDSIRTGQLNLQGLLANILNSQ